VKLYLMVGAKAFRYHIIPKVLLWFRPLAWWVFTIIQPIYQPTHSTHQPMSVLPRGTVRRVYHLLFLLPHFL